MGSTEKHLAVSSLLYSIRCLCVLIRSSWDTSSLGWVLPVHPASSHVRGFSPLILLVLKSPEWHTVLEMCFTSAEKRGRVTVLDLLAMFFKIQLPTLSAFAARVHHSQLPVYRDSEVFLWQGAFQLVLYGCLGLQFSRFRILPFPLLNIMGIPSDQFFILSKSLQIAGPLLYQPPLTLFYHLWTCWWFSMVINEGHQTVLAPVPIPGVHY